MSSLKKKMMIYHLSIPRTLPNAGDMSDVKCTFVGREPGRRGEEREVEGGEGRRGARD